MKNEAIKDIDISIWISRAKEDLEVSNGIDRNSGKNEIDKSLKHLKAAKEHFENSLKWWKNSVETKDFHEAEKLSKIMNSEYVRLEKEKKQQ